MSNKIITSTFLEYYSPAQELSVDESMIKYKGHEVARYACLESL